MLLVGTVFGLLAPAQTGWLTPVGTVFLQASQIVVMPFLIGELFVGFGKLQVGTLGMLGRRGGLVLLCRFYSSPIPRDRTKSRMASSA